ncbi:MAG: MotA/TolQ/ExbB proton channel family protein [Armatimonadota bacterium]
MEFIRGGGVMMYPLLGSSVLMIALIIERFVTLRKLNKDGDELLEVVKGSAPDYAKASAECKTIGGALGRMYSRGLRNATRPADAIEMAMEQEASNELPQLDANLPVIKTIINIAPLLGLLGTIAGMITAFRAASQTGLSNPTQILGGISEALISTATGITIAVIGFIFYNYFANQSKKIVEDMEYYGAELVNLLTDRVS